MSRTATTGGRFLLDPLCLVFFTIQALVSIWLITKYGTVDQRVVNGAVGFGLMTALGLCGHLAFLRNGNSDSYRDKSISISESKSMWLMIGFGTIIIFISQMIIQEAIPQTIAFVTPLEASAWYFSAAVAEATMFRYFVQTALHQRLPHNLFTVGLVIVVVSILFTGYHTVVYQTNISALYAVFVGSITLSSLYYASRRLSVPQSIHAIVNAVASLK